MEDKSDIYEEILGNGPSQTTLHIVLRQIKNEGRNNEVIKWCMRFLKVYPEDAHLRVLLGESYLASGLIGQAETEYLKAIALTGHLLRAHARLADIYARQKRFSEAAGEASIFLAHHPEDSEMRQLLKEMEAREARQKTPAQEWPVLPDEDAESPAAFATPTIAELYYSQGQLDAAVETYERVVAERPHDSASAARLSELKKVLNPGSDGEAKKSDKTRREKEKLLFILEKWLPKVGELKYG